MKRGGWKWITVAFAASGCVAPGEAPVAKPAPAAQAPSAAAAKFPTLRNPGFELEALRGARCATGWNCTMHKLAKCSAPWESHSVEFDVPANAETVEVGVMLRRTGRACFDDARLEVLRPAKNPV